MHLMIHFIRPITTLERENGNTPKAVTMTLLYRRRLVQLPLSILWINLVGYMGMTRLFYIRQFSRPIIVKAWPGSIAVESGLFAICFLIFGIIIRRYRIPICRLFGFPNKSNAPFCRFHTEAVTALSVSTTLYWYCCSNPSNKGVFMSDLYI